MLNTVMALWNQHPGENRQRMVKLLFTCLFVGVSIFLLLFTLNSSAWSSVIEHEQIQAKKEGPVQVDNHSGGTIPVPSPTSVDVVAGIVPATTRTPIQICVHTPTVVVRPIVAPPQRVIYASRNHALNPKSSKPHLVRPRATHVKKDKPHPRKRSHVKVITTPVPEQTIIIMPSPSPVSVTPSPTVTPVVTDSVTQTPVSAEGTAVSSMPDIVIIDATPDTSMAFTNSFSQSLRKKEAMHIPVPSVSKSTKKSTTKDSTSVHDEVECSGSTTYKKDDSKETIVKAKRHAGLLLGSSLLGTLLFCCFMFARKREK